MNASVEHSAKRGALFLFAWDKHSAYNHAEVLRRHGWVVEMETDNGTRGFRTVVSQMPDVVVFDMSTKPAHSIETAEALQMRKSTKHTPMVFVDASNEITKKVQQRISDAVMVTSSTLLSVLEHFEQRRLQEI